LYYAILSSSVLISLPLGAYSKGGRGACPQSSIEWIFMEKRLCCDCSLYQKCFVDLKYAKKCVGGRGFSWGSSRRSPGPLVGWGGGHPSQSLPLSAPLAPRFSRVWRSASVVPNVKSWLRPCLPIQLLL